MILTQFWVGTAGSEQWHLLYVQAKTAVNKVFLLTDWWPCLSIVVCRLVIFLSLSWLVCTCSPLGTWSPNLFNSYFKSVLRILGLHSTTVNLWQKDCLCPEIELFSALIQQRRSPCCPPWREATISKAVCSRAAASSRRKSTSSGLKLDTALSDRHLLYKTCFLYRKNL